MSDMELAKRVARLEGALSALLAELYGRNDTQADMRRLKERDPDVHSLLSGEPA